MRMRAALAIDGTCFRVLIASLVGPFGAACGDASAPPKSPRLVVLYVPCTVQKLQLKSYDSRVAFTPSLAALASESVVFARHTTEAEQSGTAFASNFTGTQADRHGVYEHPARLLPDNYLISEAFADAGFETWFWNGHPMASAELGYGQGIAPERVREPVAPRPGPLTLQDTLPLTANDAEFDRLLDRLQKDRGLRAFVQVAFTITHEPYSNYCTPQMVAAFCERFPSEAGGLTEQHFAKYMPIYEQHRLALQWNHSGTTEDLGLSDEEIGELARVVEVVYQTTIHELDRLFGAFLDRIRARGLWDESLIAFTSDHGEVLYRDNALFQWTHSLQLAPESLDVPLIIHSPGTGTKLRAYEGVTRSIDVFPTLAGLCGIELPGARGIEGVDLSPVLRGDASERELLAFSHSTTLSEVQLDRLRAFPTIARLFSSGGVEGMWVRVRSRDLVVKLRNLDGSQWGIEVFDLASDPEERRNLYEPGNPRQEALVSDLRAYKDRMTGAYAPADASLPEEEQLRRLRSLGYVR